jgi:hypothetical protein
MRHAEAPCPRAMHSSNHNTQTIYLMPGVPLIPEGPNVRKLAWASCALMPMIADLASISQIVTPWHTADSELVWTRIGFCKLYTSMQALTQFDDICAKWQSCMGAHVLPGSGAMAARYACARAPGGKATLLRELPELLTYFMRVYIPQRRDSTQCWRQTPLNRRHGSMPVDRRHVCQRRQLSMRTKSALRLRGASCCDSLSNRTVTAAACQLQSRHVNNQ